MLELIEYVLSRLEKANLTVHPDKMSFMQTSITFLGHKLTRLGTQPSDQKTQALNDFPRPRTTKQVQSFLGLSGFYRKFCENYSEKAHPLVNLTKKDAKFEWLEHQTAFDTLKSALCSAPILRFPDFSNNEFTIYVDASQYCGGGIISQRFDDGLHPIAYFSKTFQPSQTRYSATERELLAIILLIKQFRHFLIGRKLEIHSDHASLRYLNSLKETSNARLCNWSIILSEFDITMKFKSGRENAAADAMS